MPRTIFVKIYQSKGNSDTVAMGIISKELRKSLKLKKGDTLEVRVDDKNGLLIYSGDKTMMLHVDSMSYSMLSSYFCFRYIQCCCNETLFKVATFKTSAIVFYTQLL